MFVNISPAASSLNESVKYALNVCNSVNFTDKKKKKPNVAL